MTILEFFKTVHPSVLAAKMIFRHLQEHYPVLKIADIADTTSGGTPNRGMPEYYNGNIPWVKSGELKDGLITTCDEYITEAGLKNSSAKLFPKGTLLVAMYGANIGKTGVLDFDATTNQAVCAIFPKIDISRDYLYWYFKQQRIDFIAVGKGGAQPNISQTIINNASIVVPDEKVQDKIVRFLERIEKGDGIDYDFFIPEVLKDVETIYKYKNSYETLSDSFETQLTQLENLNQAILQEAVQGKLVPQDPNDEPASELLERIKAEKAKSGKKEKSLPLITPEEIPFEIPENWVWCRLGDMSVNRDEDRKPISQAERNGRKKIYDYYGASGVIDKIDGYTHEGELLLIGEDGANLVTRSTPIAFIAKGQFWVNNHAHVLDTIDRITLDYLCAYINSIDLRPFVTGGFQPKLSQGNLNIIPVPLPPLSEQKRIVVEIERQLAKTKQLKEHIIANQQATEQLLKALLHQAFEVKEMEEV
jgi:type I restriction enzyme S subunit